MCSFASLRIFHPVAAGRASLLACSNRGKWPGPACPQELANGSHGGGASCGTLTLAGRPAPWKKDSHEKRGGTWMRVFFTRVVSSA